MSGLMLSSTRRTARGSDDINEKFWVRSTMIWPLLPAAWAALPPRRARRAGVCGRAVGMPTRPAAWVAVPVVVDRLLPVRLPAGMNRVCTWELSPANVTTVVPPAAREPLPFLPFFLAAFSAAIKSLKLCLKYSSSPPPPAASPCKLAEALVSGALGKSGIGGASMAEVLSAAALALGAALCSVAALALAAGCSFSSSPLNQSMALLMPRLALPSTGISSIFFPIQVAASATESIIRLMMPHAH